LKQEVLNLDAVEDLLGKRPFANSGLQNIDRYRCETAVTKNHTDNVKPAMACATSAALLQFKTAFLLLSSGGTFVGLMYS